MIHFSKIKITIVVLLLGISFNVFSQAKLPESPIKTIYVTPTSHYDFGFVEPPDQIRERAARHIDEVIRVAESDPEFRWTIESVWQLDEWLKRQKKLTSVLPKDTDKINRLVKLIKSGQIALSTAWGSMHTDFMGAEELNRICYDYAILKRSYGIESEFAMMDDVPGHPSSMPSVLAGSGMKYLSVGANIFIGVSTSLAPGKVPFYWESPDGNKILTWVSQSTRGGYTEGMTDFYLDPYSVDPYTNERPYDMFNPKSAGKTDLQIMEEGVTELINRYQKGGYKYDAVMAYYAHDFVEPTNVGNLEKAVKLWNSNHNEIKLKISTPPEFLKYIETKYAGEIPTYRGEWSGLWSEAKTQSPNISAMARFAHDHAPSDETLWSANSMTRKIPFPVGNFTGIYDLMMTYDEHSGAGNNGWIQLNDRQKLDEQNHQYVEFMKKATGELDFLSRQGLNLIAQPTRFDKVKSKAPNTWNLLVYNGLSWSRNDIVKSVSPKEGLIVTSIRDLSTNQTIKFDTDDQGQFSFVAKDIPSFGYRTFLIETAPGKAVSTLHLLPKTIEATNANFRIKMRSDGNIQSIFDIKQNRELVNNEGELPFNQLLRIEGQDASVLNYPNLPVISVKKGLQMSEIAISRESSAFPLTKITIYDDLDRVDLHNELDGNQFPFIGGNGNWNDSYYFAFPFNVSKNNLKVLRGGQKWIDRLPDDYLPGARWDSVTTQHLIGFTDGKTSAMLANRQAFHWIYPGFVATKIQPKDAPKGFPAMFTGKFPLPEATIYSRAIRKSNQADTHDLGIVNMQSVEPGLAQNCVFDYAIAGSGVFDDVRAWKLGSDFNVPLQTAFVNATPNDLVKSFFSVNQPNIEIVTVKPISNSVVHGAVTASPLDPQLDKIFIIRLQEFAGKEATAQINLPVKIKSASILNLTEDKILQNITQISPLTIRLKPFETKTIRIEIE